METVDPTVAALHELTAELQRLDVAPAVIARHVTDVLERSGLAPLDLTEYLLAKGFKGPRLAQAMGTFAPAVKAGYVLSRGAVPLRRERAGRIVNWYTELDRPLVDEVFAGWSR
jgi:hypothetical protein